MYKRQAYALNGLGDLARTEGRLDEAGTRFADSLRLSREIGDQRGIADALRNLGWLACQAGRSDEAFVDLHEAMERFAAMEDRIEMCIRDRSRAAQTRSVNSFMLPPTCCLLYTSRCV